MPHRKPTLDVFCTGSAYEMGRQQGEALSNSIGDARSILRELEAFRLQQPGWIPFPAYRWIAECKALRFVQQALANHRASWDRLRGIADGAQTSLKSLALLNSLEIALSSLGDSTVSLGGCSAVAVRRSMSKTSEPIVAKNFDYLPLVQSLYSVRRTRPKHSSPDGSFESIEFTAAPLCGVVDGINSGGLAITYNYAFTSDYSERPAAPISVVIGKALAQCGSVVEAAEFIDRTPRCGGGILMLADSAGAIASLEVSNTRTKLRIPADGQDFICHSNCFVTPDMQSVQLPVETIYSQNAPIALRGQRLHESAEVRDARFNELLKAAGDLNESQLLQIMADHGSDNQPSDHTPCVHGSYWHTTASLQLFPNRRQLSVDYSTACEAGLVDFHLS